MEKYPAEKKAGNVKNDERKEATRLRLVDILKRDERLQKLLSDSTFRRAVGEVSEAKDKKAVIQHLLAVYPDFIYFADSLRQEE